MDEHSLLLFLFGVFLFCSSAVDKATATCTLPTTLTNSEWRDSRSGLVTFTDTQAAGWSFTVSSSQTRDQWACHLYNETDGYLVMKATETFIQFVVNVYTAYRCMKLKQVTDSSYRYYLINPKQTSLEDERLHISESNSETNWDLLCNTQYGASGAEFIVLVRTDNVVDAKIQLPYLFLAEYEFTLTSTSTCDVTTATSTIEMCADNYAFAITGPNCAESLFFTNAAALWGVDVVTDGSTTFIALYNGLQDSATVDGTNTFFFTCIAINSDHNEASVVPEYCRENQTSSALPTDTNVGSTLSLTAVSAPCPPCPILSNPTEGNVTKVTDGAVTTATYMCNTGFTLSGDTTRVCQTNGSWSGTGASCTCAFPSAPVNGSVSLTADGLSVTYMCNSGMVLVGSSTRTCQTDLNAWTGTEPTCVAAATSATSTSSELNLLPAVIVLAILAVLFAAAFSAAVCYIVKNRQRQKWQSQLTNLDQGFPDADIVSAPPAAPMDHKRPLFDLSRMLSSSQAPASHAPTPSGLPSNRSSKSANSTLSFGSPRLELIKDATVSSIVMTPSEPAPWSRKNQRKTQRPTPNELSLDLSNLTSRSETGDETARNTMSHTPRRKKIIMSKPKVDQNMNTLSSTSTTSTGLSDNPLMPSEGISRKSSRGGEPSNVSRRSTRTEGRRRAREERASTAVKHVLAVRDPDDKRTPRSNRIATVQ